MNIIKYYAGYLVRYLRGTRAVAAMEYAIIVGVVVVGVGAAVVLFQEKITAFIAEAGDQITAAQGDTFATIWQVIFLSGLRVQSQGGADLVVPAPVSLHSCEISDWRV